MTYVKICMADPGFNPMWIAEYRDLKKINGLWIKESVNKSLEAWLIGLSVVSLFCTESASDRTVEYCWSTVVRKSNC